MPMMKYKRRKFILLLVVAFLFSLTTFIEKAELQSKDRGQSANRVESGARPAGTKYFALIIGNNQYQHLGKLKTAVNDAVELEGVLRQTYGFETKLLRDADREQIVDALNDYRRRLDEQSYLLIYYAGHGYYDKSIDAAYWLPVDARRDSDTRWISADDVTRNVRGIAAMHVLIISDSCYSGTLKRESIVGITPAERQRFLNKMRGGRSRILIASGGNEPVDDGGGDGHSVFASALLRGLQRIESSEFTAGELFNRFILEQVAGRARQTPEYGLIRNSGHDSGDFVFVRRDAIVSNTTESVPMPARKKSPQEDSKPQNYTEMVNGVGIEMVRIPAGKFLMGSPNSEAFRHLEEEPQHEITISQSFYMGKYEVTQAQWRAVAQLPKVKIDLNPDPSQFKGDNLPVEQVNWEETVEFCKRLSRTTGNIYRLPTEAEWEYACRAGTRGAYAGNLDEMAWRGDNSEDTTHLVGQKQANQFGLYDVHGNVWEWCQDWYDENYYRQSPSRDPRGPKTGLYRVFRGGGFGTSVRELRSASRNRNTPSFYLNGIGFRIVRTVS